MGVNFYLLDKARKDLFARIALESEITPDLEQELINLSNNTEIVIIDAKKYMEKENDLVELAEKKAAYYSSIAKAAKDSVKSVKEWIKNYMVENDIKSIEIGIDKVQLVDGKNSVTIFDEVEVPDSMVKYSVKLDNEEFKLLKLALAIGGKNEPNFTTAVNKLAILKSYKDTGIETSGTTIVKSKSLRMR